MIRKKGKKHLDVISGKPGIVSALKINNLLFEDLKYWTVGVLNGEEWANGYVGEKLPSVVLEETYRAMNPVTRECIQDVLIDLLQSSFYSGSNRVSHDYVDELLIAIGNILPGTQRCDDVRTLVIEIVNNQSLFYCFSSSNIQKRFLGLLIALGYKGFPDFWMNLAKIYGENVEGVVLRGLATTSLKNAIQWIFLKKTNPEVIQTLFSLIPQWFDDYGVDKITPYLKQLTLQLGDSISKSLTAIILQTGEPFVSAQDLSVSSEKLIILLSEMLEMHYEELNPCDFFDNVDQLLVQIAGERQRLNILSIALEETIQKGFLRELPIMPLDQRFFSIVRKFQPDRAFSILGTMLVGYLKKNEKWSHQEIADYSAWFREICSCKAVNNLSFSELWQDVLRVVFVNFQTLPDGITIIMDEFDTDEICVVIEEILCIDEVDHDKLVDYLKRSFSDKEMLEMALDKWTTRSYREGMRIPQKLRYRLNDMVFQLSRELSIDSGPKMILKQFELFDHQETGIKQEFDDIMKQYPKPLL